ncbi:hypothetical protein PHLCEN_2v4613 [Hermanssonia centrifuga]|uniref:Exocyst complex component SEC15 n=1 Tax=Hermanssonia centrifuga TaxID=98765 RepID=A0A2R6PMS5_9APHY|nr:hypothetical protein PHLCEN_2v4613 [Hermanssonia centrifuga]
MPPRRRPQFTQENIDQQLQQIHLLDPSSTSENLEQLGPIIKQIHTNRQQDAYLRTVKGLIESKDAEIETICGDNYQEFISSVSTLFSIKSYTTNLRDTITLLDQSVAQVGRGLVEKKKALLQSKKTAANLDEAIDTLQACLRVLDVVHRVGEMINEGKYWSALRSLEDIESMPPTSLSQTPLFQHLLSSLPSLRGQIKDAVNASKKQWLLDIRNVSALVGQLALEAMDARTRKWRARRDKDPVLKLSRVGSAVETMTYEKTEHNVLDNERLKVDFTPLYQCIHIYSALDALDEIRKSYQADRKAQSDLIIPETLPLGSLSSVTQEIVGFFIIETHVLSTTGNFRSERDVEELWDALVSRLSGVVDRMLQSETDADSFLRVKEGLIGFVMTLETYTYSTTSLHSFILLLFERYVSLLENQFGKRFQDIISQDDCLPMYVEKTSEYTGVLDTVLLSKDEREQLDQSSQRGGQIRVNAAQSFQATLTRALSRVNASITSKLDDFFGLSEYDWTPTTRESAPSMYLYELVNWLTTVVDSLVIKQEYKDEAYRNAVEYLEDCLMDFLTGRNIPMMNENAISNILVDVDFLEEEFKRIGRSQLMAAFTELRSRNLRVLDPNVEINHRGKEGRDAGKKPRLSEGYFLARTVDDVDHA